MIAKETPQKVVVTGGSGFIGSHLVDGLVEKGFLVHSVDIADAHKNPRATYHTADIRKKEALASIFTGARYIFHTAALPRVQPSILDPVSTHDINVNGTLNVLLAAKDAGVKRVVYSASSSAYGDQEMLPLTEDMAANPMSPYGLQKYIGELYCRLFSHVYGLETVSLRYFNVYGPRASADGAYALVIARFLEQRKKGDSMTVVPDGTQSRDFTHVFDVVRANICAAGSPHVGRGEVINIGGGKNTSVLEIAKLIGGPWTFIEPRLEPKHTQADIAKAKRLLGWEPQISFEEGIQELKETHGIA